MDLERWRQVRLGEVLTQISRARPVGLDRNYQLLGVRWYGNGCHLHDTIPGAKLKTPVLNSVEVGDVTYNKMWVSKGAFAVVDENHGGLFATNEYPTFKAVTDLAYPPFLRWKFRDQGFVSLARNSCRGTTSRARLNPKDFLELPLALPPLGEQRKIAAILSSVDEAIEATRAVIDQIQVAKNAMMAELLKRGLPRRHTRFKQTEVGEVPEEWEIARVDDLCSVVRGSTPRPAKDPRYFGGSAVPWITIGELSKDDWPYLTSVESGLTEEGQARSRFLERGTVVLSNSGFGCGVPKILALSGCANDGVAAFIGLKKSVPLFLYYVLASMTEYLRKSVARGVEQPNLNTTLIGDLRVVCPPITEQHEIADVLMSIDERLRGERTAGKSLAGVKASLMSVLLTGEVRVIPDEVAA